MDKLRSGSVYPARSRNEQVASGRSTLKLKKLEKRYAARVEGVYPLRSSTRHSGQYRQYLALGVSVQRDRRAIFRAPHRRRCSRNDALASRKDTIPRTRHSGRGNCGFAAGNAANGDFFQTLCACRLSAGGHSRKLMENGKNTFDQANRQVYQFMSREKYRAANSRALQWPLTSIKSARYIPRAFIPIFHPRTQKGA